MGQINKIPLGYLNMLGSQTGGKNPFFAAEQVNPTVEMAPFYHGSAMAVSTDVLVSTAPGDEVTRFVPANEAWFLYSIGASGSVLGSSAVRDLQVNLQHLPRSSSPTLPGQIATLTSSTASAAGDVIAASQLFPVPIPLIAGTSIQTIINRRSGATTMTISYVYAKFTA